jgi:hypothetical protein
VFFKIGIDKIQQFHIPYRRRTAQARQIAEERLSLGVSFDVYPGSLFHTTTSARNLIFSTFRGSRTKYASKINWNTCFQTGRSNSCRVANKRGTCYPGTPTGRDSLVRAINPSANNHAAGTYHTIIITAPRCVNASQKNAPTSIGFELLAMTRDS